MNKSRILFYLSISMAIGVFLSACAAVATGHFDTGNRALTGGPMIQLWQAPSLENTTADTLQVQAPLAAHRSMEMYRSAQAADQIERQTGHLCLGDD